METRGSPVVSLFSSSCFRSLTSSCLHIVYKFIVYFWRGGLREVLIFFGTFLVGSWLFVVTPLKKNLHQNKQYLWCCFVNRSQSKHLKASPIMKPRTKSLTADHPQNPTSRSARHRIPLRSAWTWTDATLQDFPNKISGFYCFYPMENRNILFTPQKEIISETPGSSKSLKLINLCYQNYLLIFLNDVPMNQNDFGCTKWIVFQFSWDIQ